jgi:hypothetical protein
MTPAEKVAMGSKISRTMLRHSRGLPQPSAQWDRLAPLVQQFHYAMEQQTRRDGETIASLVRTLQSPRVLARNDVELFGEYVRSIVRQELNSRRTD